MAELYDTVVQTIKDRCPGINWKLGGLLRELLAEPVSAMQDAVSSYISKALESLNIDAALDSPAEHEDTLNVWMKRLRIAEPGSKKSTGVVTVLVSSVDKSITIPSKTVFECGDTRLEVAETAIATPITARKIADDCFSLDVQVDSITATGINIAAGSPVTWNSAPAQVIDTYVSTAITGGSGSMTAQEKANAISAELDKGSISGELALSAALRKMFSGTVVSASTIPGNAAKIPLFVKLKPLPITTEKSYKLLDGQCSVVITDPGVVLVDSVIVDGVKKLFTTTYTADGLTVSWEYCAGSEARISCLEFSDLSKINAWLNSAQMALPYQFECKAPAVAYVKLFINAEGSDIDLVTKSEIQEYICDKPLNASLKDSEIASILNKHRYTHSGAILYSVTVKSAEYTDVWSSSGSLNPAGQLNLGGRPVAMYTTIADIESC